MNTTGFVVRALLLGYLFTGYFGLMTETAKRPLDKIGLLIQPTFLKKTYFVLFWFIFVFLETYYDHMPRKSEAVVYGLASVPSMWLGFSLFGALVLWPQIAIDSFWIGFLSSAAMFLVGATILAPIFAMISLLATILIAKPIVYFLPKAP